VSSLRRLAALVLGALLLAGCGARPHSTARRLYWIQAVDVPIAEQCREGFVAGLPTAGLEEGVDYTLTIRSAQGDLASLTALLGEAMDRRADLIAVSATPAMQAAIRQVKGIPIVAINADPVAAGAGRSDTDHLPFLTGVALMPDHDRMLDLIRQVLPRSRSLGTLFSPAEDNSVIVLRKFEAAARARGFTVVSVPAAASTDVPDAVRTLLAQPLDAVCQISDNASATGFPAIAAQARTARRPLFAFASDQAAKGAILSVSQDFHQAGRDAAQLAARILRGEDPSSLPIRKVSRSVVIVNLRAADAAGIAIPAALLASADTVIR